MSSSSRDSRDSGRDGRRDLPRGILPIKDALNGQTKYKKIRYFCSLELGAQCRSLKLERHDLDLIGCEQPALPEGLPPYEGELDKYVRRLHIPAFSSCVPQIHKQHQDDVLFLGSVALQLRACLQVCHCCHFPARMRSAVRVVN